MMDTPSVPWPDRDGALVRARVRELATFNNDAVLASIQRGENSQQFLLDQFDVLKEYIASLPEEHRAPFERMYAEELHALTAATKAKTALLVASNTSKQQQQAILAALGVGIVVWLLFQWMAA